MKPAQQRLESLDVLRGFDLFCLTILCPLLHSFHHAGKYEWMTPVIRQFTHVRWEGFAFWDLIMPLFMFMAGVSIPFALAKYQQTEGNRFHIYRRILKRVCVLWILGMICQANLLALNIDLLRIFSNTLQAIAVGYLFSSLIFLHTNLRLQIIISAALLLIYWGSMTFISIDGFGAGNFTPSGNLAEWIDRITLGRWRDFAHIDESGVVVFAPWYSYTWILSSLNFVVTVMTGVFAGQILKSHSPEKKKLLTLFAIGIGMIAGGWLWELQMPVIKTIWTSSMVLVSSGYCFLLMGLFYYVIDYKGYRKGWTWLKIIGTNSIVAYVLSVEVGVFNFSCISHSLLFGFKQFMSAEFYNFVILTANLLLVYGLLYVLYKRNIFIKV